MSDVAQRATRLVRAVAEGDTWGSDLLLNTSAGELAELALELASRVAPTDNEPEVIETAVKHAALLYHTTSEAVLSSSRRREDVDARQIACFVARQFGCSYSLIGRQIRRDHTTVISGCERVANSPKMQSAANRVAVAMGWERDRPEAS